MQFICTFSTISVNLVVITSISTYQFVFKKLYWRIFCKKELKLVFLFRYADLTQRLKNSYPRSHGVLGIGYSYNDLQFLAESDVGIGLSPNLPTDLMVDNLDKVKIKA